MKNKIHAQSRDSLTDGSFFIMETLCGIVLYNSAVNTADYGEEITCKNCLKLLRENNKFIAVLINESF
jgi:hypothetical protein